MTDETTSTNRRKIDQLQEAVMELLDQVLEEGFSGEAGVELSIQDGTIQTIHTTMKRIKLDERE